MNASDVSGKDDLLRLDEQRDRAVAGRSLSEPGATRLANKGAHDPTPTPYFILEELFSNFSFSQDSHLLDVGCGTGRVLAYFVEAGFPGRATGIELDAVLAEETSLWARRFAPLRVVGGNVLEHSLARYTHLYLFNPFDTNILMAFLAKIEAEVAHPVSLIHMSDNGETYFYVGRPGWSMVKQGEFQRYRSAKGRSFAVYEHPQHYSVWQYDPALR